MDANCRCGRVHKPIYNLWKHPERDQLPYAIAKDAVLVSGCRDRGRRRPRRDGAAKNNYNCRREKERRGQGDKHGGETAGPLVNDADYILPGEPPIRAPIELISANPPAIAGPLRNRAGRL